MILMTKVHAAAGSKKVEEELAAAVAAMKDVDTACAELESQLSSAKEERRALEENHTAGQFLEVDLCFLL